MEICDSEKGNGSDLFSTKVSNEENGRVNTRTVPRGDFDKRTEVKSGFRFRVLEVCPHI